MYAKMCNEQDDVGDHASDISYSSKTINTEVKSLYLI
jgi:hypothetical protein